MTTTKPTRDEMIDAIDRYALAAYNVGADRREREQLIAMIEALTPEPNPATATLEAGETIHQCQDCGTRFVAGDDQDHLWAFVGSKTLCPQCYERRVTPEPDQHAGAIIRTAIQDYAADYSPLDDQRMSDGTADLIIDRMKQAGLVIRERGMVCISLATAKMVRRFISERTTSVFIPSEVKALDAAIAAADGRTP